MIAVERAADPAYALGGEPWQVSRVLALAIPCSIIERGVEAGLFPDGGDMPGVPDDEIAVVVDGAGQWEAKLAAMRAYKSQIDLSTGMWAMLVKEPLFAFESFVLLAGTPFESNTSGDVFAGLL
jgi:N-acetyl-1-D-myo-inositol-2-amino-2-deoxy-alpha-D-glucopyranoside deacetylase